MVLSCTNVIGTNTKYLKTNANTYILTGSYI